MNRRLQVRLSKHHGLGNDFLVCDVAQTPPRGDWAMLARRWCDRRTGVGADGLLLLERLGERRYSMVLHNADGSRAEMSGNGIRCLVQAAHRIETTVHGGGGRVYDIETDAGVRRVEVESAGDGLGGTFGDTLQIVVDMGSVTDLPVPADWERLECNPDRPVRHVSLGNPHSVVGVDDVRAVDLARLGGIVPHVNLEIVEPGPEPHAITMRVHERGAGITMACGTGACAAAEAAVAWGLVPASVPEVVVHMDGGDARVRVDTANRHITLIGPATFIADVTVPL